MLNKIALGVLISFFALFLAIAWTIAVFPNFVRASLLVLADLFANHKPPTIFADQLNADSWKDLNGTSQRLTEELLRQFPTGSDESRLKSKLIGQGFQVPTPPPTNCIPPGGPEPIGLVSVRCSTADRELQRNRSLEYNWGNVPCGERVLVLWHANDQNLITQLRAGYRYICL